MTTVLIVEDSPDISQPLSDAFRFAGFAVLQAATAVQALQLASELRPDLVLMDIQLPDLDGLSVATTLKNDQATRHIPIIAMTAYDIVGEQAKAISKTCIAYAQKPVRSREIVNLASAILKLPGKPVEVPRRTPPSPPRSGRR
jgi:two-component system, cell cycle response regulator DivK